MHSEQLRKQWGCDGPASVPFAYLTCERCFGRDRKCDLCKGNPKGRPHTVCPNKNRNHSIGLAISSHALLEAGLLPVEGGIMDQTQAWLVSMQIIGSEQAKHREAEWEMTQSSK